jgi:hypothetical protein
MQQVAQEQAAAWDESLSEEQRQTIVTSVERKLEAHMVEFRAEWARLEGQIPAEMAKQAEA